MEIVIGALLVIVIDQVTKNFVQSRNPFVYINYGIIFGLFKGNQYVGWLYTIAWLVLAYYLYLNFDLNDFSLSLIVGGTISNKIDRFRVGGAIDWIDLWGPIRRINVADIGITIGLLIWIIDKINI